MLGRPEGWIEGTSDEEKGSDRMLLALFLRGRNLPCGYESPGRLVFISENMVKGGDVKGLNLESIRDEDEEQTIDTCSEEREIF